MRINRNQVYEVDNYKFKNFIVLDQDTIEKIRLWRNHPEIRKEMYNKDEISSDQHQKFIKSLSDSNHRYYWLVYKDNIPIGIVNIVDINYSVESGESGSYLLPEFIGSGIGLEFVSNLLSFLFTKIGLKKVFARTELGNRNALTINYHLGFQFYPETIEINSISFIEMSLEGSRFIERLPKIHKAKELLKSIREFNKIYNTYK